MEKENQNSLPSGGVGVGALVSIIMGSTSDL